MQFHWQNRTPPYRDFDDFLGAFPLAQPQAGAQGAAGRAGHGLRLATLEGPALGPREWQALERLYDDNVAKHGSPTYLTPQFFAILQKELAHRVVATLAYRDDVPGGRDPQLRARASTSTAATGAASRSTRCCTSSSATTA
jgi:predicted N-acyltransferase